MDQSSPSAPHRRFTPVRLLAVLAVVAAFAAGMLAGRDDAPTPANQPADAGHQAPGQDAVWTCSMHPQIKLPRAGQCPICFMDLIPLEQGDDQELGPRTLAMSEGAAALAEIRTAAVRHQAVETQVRLIGKVAYDETRHKVIAARTAGRLDTLFVDFTGTSVAVGQPLASLYSPDLFAGQVELLSALKARDDLRESSDPELRRTAEATVVSARERLRLWGLGSDRIEEIESAGRASDHLTITAPLGGVVVRKHVSEGMYVAVGGPIYSVADLSRVWVTLQAYEADLAWLRTGQTVDFTVEALPGDRFRGQIAFIDPALDEKTRTVGVRLDVANEEGLLKPGMFVNALAAAAPAAGSADGGPALVIPASAPLITGRRAVVYVQLPDTPRPTFEGREVVLGPRAGDVYLVVSGLAEGEQVVTRGNFKIDSALQIQAKPSMMSADPPARFEPASVPAAFGQQLQAVVAAYLDLTAALAADDDPRAARAAQAARGALAAVDGSLLTGRAASAWQGQAGPLGASFAALAAAGDIATRRRELLAVADPLWAALDGFGFQPPQPLRRFHCPMADGNQGGDWIQLEAVTANPYFGASMLRCGSQTGSLAADAPGKDR